MSAVFPSKRSVGAAPCDAKEQFNGAVFAPSKTHGWDWRDVVAQAAYRSGALKMLDLISTKWELSSSPNKSWPRFRRISHPKYSILCYHRVGTEGIPYYSTLAPSQFEAQMRFLRENFRVISLSQLCSELGRSNSSQHGVAVTFDDGYSDLYTYALPILRKYEIPATIYLTVDCIETGEVAWYDRIFLALQVAPGHKIDLHVPSRAHFDLGTPVQRIAIASQIVQNLRRVNTAERKRFCIDLEQQITLPLEKLTGRMLSWRQIGEMRSAGIFFGSHTLSHPVLSSLSAEETYVELSESKRVLEARLGEGVLDFAFPFGKPADCGSRTHAMVAQCGYRSAVTTSWGTNSLGSDMHALRRIQLGDTFCPARFGLQLEREFLWASELPSGISEHLLAQDSCTDSCFGPARMK